MPLQSVFRIVIVDTIHMNKLYFSRIACGALVALLLTGCSFFSADKSRYKEAGVLEPIRLPAGVQAASVESAYRIPDVEAREFDYVDIDDKLVIPRPAPMSQDAEFARVKIQKVGERRWILAEAPTSQVWPLVQSFLARNGILVAKAQPKTGEIETNWLSFKVDSTTQSRYHIGIEKGVRENSSEVHVLHQQISGGSKPTNWPTISSDSEREAWLLDELAVSIAEGVSNRAASLLGQSVGGKDKITLRRESKEPVIDIRLDQERAQATLAHALTQEGLNLWTEDKASGTFYFGYDDPNDEPGFWRKMTFRGNDDMPEQAPADLKALVSAMSPAATPVFGDIAAFNIQSEGSPVLGYLLRARYQDNGTDDPKIIVRVRDTRGEILPYQEAKKVMIAIRRNLI